MKTLLPRRAILTEVECLQLSYYGPDAPPPRPAPLTKEQEIAAFIRFRKKKTGRDRELLVRQYLCWSFGMAAKYKGPRLGFDEAISVANLGLMQALNDFDPSRGYRFTTYAAFAVRRHLIEAIVGTYPVHVSDHVRKKWRDATVSPADLAAQMIDDEPRTLEEFFSRLGETSDFDTTLMHERPEDAPFCPAPSENPAEELERSSLPAEVRVAVRRLLPLEREAIVARHYREYPESFEAIGRRLKRSKNRVREAYESALVKLRSRFSHE